MEQEYYIYGSKDVWLLYACHELHVFCRPLTYTRVFIHAMYRYW